MFGAGRIGPLVVLKSARCGDYYVTIADIQMSLNIKQILSTEPNNQLGNLDINDVDQTIGLMRASGIKTLISCLPYYWNVVAAKNGFNYFDLTEDINTIENIHALAAKSDARFLPQRGLAPGLVSVIAQGLLNDFDSVDRLTIRVGAVPMNVSNPLNYALTWSTEG